MATKQIEINSISKLEPGDVVSEVRAGGYAKVEREVIEVVYPPNTVYLFSGREPFVKGLDGKWRDTWGNHRPTVNDENINEWLEGGFTNDRILFNPDDTKED